MMKKKNDISQTGYVSQQSQSVVRIGSCVYFTRVSLELDYTSKLYLMA